MLSLNTVIYIRNSVAFLFSFELAKFMNREVLTDKVQVGFEF